MDSRHRGHPQAARRRRPAARGHALALPSLAMTDHRPAATPTITFDDFLRVDVRVGRIVEARPFPGARKPAFQLELDFGPELGRRRSSAQLTQRYEAEA